jgi:hypothetical protein
MLFAGKDIRYFVVMLLRFTNKKESLRVKGQRRKGEREADKAL